MSHELDRVAELSRKSVHGEAWHGPSVVEAIDGVDARVASMRLIEGVHTIAEIVGHVDFTVRLVLERVEERGRLWKEGEGWPEPPTPLTEDAWVAMVARLTGTAAELEAAIRRMPEAKLDVPLVEGGSSGRKNIIGILEHNAYHGGQIMVLKKLAKGRA